MESSADLILRAPADAPWVLHAAAWLLLYLHIGGGTVGMASGAVALLSRKGERLHRAAGNVFFVSMLLMAGVAAATAPFIPSAPGEQLTNTTAGLFTFYLVATSWTTVKRPEREVGRLEVGAVAVPAGIAVMGLLLATTKLGGPDRTVYATVYAFAAVAAIAVAGDLHAIRRGGLAGTPRVARHLWRMCLALFIAVGSFFLGQSDEIPAALRGPQLAIPPLAVLALMAFWLVRVRLPRPKLAAAPA